MLLIKGGFRSSGRNWRGFLLQSSPCWLGSCNLGCLLLYLNFVTVSAN